MKLKNNRKVDLYPQYEKIKSIALIALFSDDELMEMLVLKGGNALNLIYKLAARASIDLDFSIRTKIESQNFEKIESKLRKSLEQTFNERKYQVFDFKFYERPRHPDDNNPDFWGGYRIEFKVISSQLFLENKDKEESLRRLAETLTNDHLKTFFIDISKYEYCETKVRKEYEGYTIYVYSPQMIVLEKIRAICQQMPEYMNAIRGKETGISERARDFYDIYIILEKLKIDLFTEDNLNLMKNIFAAKKVPLELIKKIQQTKEFHALGYSSLKSTVDPREELKDFDFYFDYVIKLLKDITYLLDNIPAI